jgi:hypothetical protein
MSSALSNTQRLCHHCNQFHPTSEFNRSDNMCDFACKEWDTHYFPFGQETEPEVPPCTAEQVPQPKVNQSTKYCRRCHTDHPISHYSQGYNICDKGHEYEINQKKKKKNTSLYRGESTSLYRGESTSTLVKVPLPVQVPASAGFSLQVQVPASAGFSLPVPVVNKIKLKLKLPSRSNVADTIVDSSVDTSIVALAGGANQEAGATSQRNVMSRSEWIDYCKTKKQRLKTTQESKKPIIPLQPLFTQEECVKHLEDYKEELRNKWGDEAVNNFMKYCFNPQSWGINVNNREGWVAQIKKKTSEAMKLRGVPIGEDIDA